MVSILFERSSVLSKATPIGKVDLVPKWRASGSHHWFVHEDLVIEDFIQQSHTMLG